MDPNFSVLLQDENVGLCADSNNRVGVNRIVLAVVLPVVGVLFIAGALCFIFRHRYLSFYVLFLFFILFIYT